MKIAIVGTGVSGLVAAHRLHPEHEITVYDIPWGERHAYVLARGKTQGRVLSDELDKTLHVSPLMGIDQTYAFRASEPGERLAVQVESRPREGEEGRSFDSTLSLRRRELSRALISGLLARYPAMSLQEGSRPKGFLSP